MVYFLCGLEFPLKPPQHPGDHRFGPEFIIRFVGGKIGSLEFVGISFPRILDVQMDHTDAATSTFGLIPAPLVLDVTIEALEKKVTEATPVFIRYFERIASQHSFEKTLSKILGVFVAFAFSPNKGIERIPVLSTKGFQRDAALALIARVEPKDH